MAITQTLNSELFWQDSQGRLIPKQNVKTTDILKDGLIELIAEKWEQSQSEIIYLKNWIYEEVAAYFNQIQDEYGAAPRETERATLRDYSNKYKLVIDLQNQIAFDEKLEVAKGLIDECIEKWSKESNQNLVLIIKDAFKVNQKGNVSMPRVLGLRALNIQDEKWDRAMNAITDSVIVLHSKKYIRFYQRNIKEDKWVAMTLDIASL